MSSTTAGTPPRRRAGLSGQRDRHAERRSQDFATASIRRAGRPGSRHLQGAHAVRRHGGRWRQPLRHERDRAVRVQDGLGQHRVRHERRRAGAEPHARQSADMWVGGWGINVKAGQKAQGSTTASKKLADMIKSTGEFTIEAWMAPANVVQEDAYAVSYSAGIDGSQRHARPARVSVRGADPHQRDGRERHAVAAHQGHGPRRAGLPAARGAHVRPGERPPHLCERQLHRRRRPARRRRIARATGTTASRSCSATRRHRTASGRA